MIWRTAIVSLCFWSVATAVVAGLPRQLADNRETNATGDAASPQVPTDGTPTGTPPPCSVTLPEVGQPPDGRPLPGDFGTVALRTSLWVGGEVLIPQDHVLPDGSLEMKWPWWRGPGVRGDLVIEGRRLDASAPPLRAHVLEGYGEEGFQATSLIFPTEGCWEVTGRAGEASLTFVVLVVVSKAMPETSATPPTLAPLQAIGRSSGASVANLPLPRTGKGLG